MKFQQSIASLLFASATFAFAETSVSTVRFSNEDQLNGSLNALTPERLVWSSQIFESPTSFYLKDVIDVTLNAQTPGNQGTYEAIVYLTNDDIIRGRLLAASDQVIELDTWFAGPMKLNRSMVSRIDIHEYPDSIYHGPINLEEWTQTQGEPAWTFQNARLHTTTEAGIGKNFELPEQYSISFDVAWKDSIALSIMLFSDDLTQQRTDSGYEVLFSGRQVTWRACKGHRYISSHNQATELQENEKAKIELRFSSKKSTLSVFINGELVDVWTDSEAQQLQKGQGIQFVSQNASPLEISKIQINHWDGEVEAVPEIKQRIARRFQRVEIDAPPPEKPPTEPIKPNTMKLRNGDLLEGEVLSIEGGMVTLKTPYRDVKLPVEALRTFALKPTDLERCKRQNGDIKASFPDGSSLVFRLDEVKGELLSGSSQNFGQADFKLSAFSRIEFNIYGPQLEEARK